MGKYSKILMPSIYLGVIGVMVACVFLVISGLNKYLLEKPDYNYTLDNVFEGELNPVNKNVSNSIVKPYVDESVKIGKYFYDFESSEDKQQGSLIFYENTYMQNTGVDYVSNEDFDVVSILDGEIISIEDSDVYGKVVTIKHNDNLKSVYSNVTDILATVGYKVTQGEIIAQSTKSKMNTEYNSLLHFEVYYKESPIDPENMYTLQASELQ